MSDSALLVGYAAAGMIGLSLGLMGSGGSSLAVPVLVFLMGVDPVRATGYSLFIVGVTALVGTIRNAFSGILEVKPALAFGISSVVSVYLVRRLALPAIPDELATWGSVHLTKSTAMLMLFALLMISSAAAVIYAKEPPSRRAPASNGRLAVYGALVGVVTGTVGAGGGFLIVPALVLLCGISMEKAVPTSLAIIAVNASVGFIGELQSQQTIDWPLVLPFSVITIVGMIVGLHASRLVSSRALRPAFGYFILIVGMLTVAGAALSKA